MRIYKTKIFARFLRKESIGDPDLVEACRRANQGLIDADLGGGLIKQRVARPRQGRSSGYRTILLFQSGSLAVFLAGFAKNERTNIAVDDLEDLKIIAKQWLTDPKRIEKDLAAGILNEVPDDNEG
ncbi:type II toxin-antitoxin system RelE/ParE family toxin [Rhizobium sp. VS19-DR104.2]|uniref:type II toxin-antitoxin system RelE/ParE family toxin n=1 Tax=unclassified Rhizobium TaxID=2613769 RepID=UPI001C5AC063|nr:MULTISPECIES: type II toxin-antitoxin system RelE/ParE family toxin [unclassified Rhizobium]MBZ5763673.1 type II toxin-antitoxin system RelE/ParE family toxin [Rhizobium sp. VS19-DR96]MBZ5769597.1 type II toxin-antitoxin system RelE/ParE family toxin [Rhizobium sp. VS19-DR129.2]MBZ5777026.1 type II toxin-antitoxin system RelE/ParE family toxin [Rhizobium sp. VS19-DRK62.2]MBZ5788119.1 type II toxin-antitoxin system RelE/ParE family toxin [Rhizobium sp. VS19-DR121]MBZ5805739.1 type II toxin-a